MSYILPNELQENILEKFRLVIPENELKNARFSCAEKREKNYIDACKKLYLDPKKEDIVVAWYHLGYRYLRGLL